MHISWLKFTYAFLYCKIFSLPVLIVFPFVSLLIGLVLSICFYWMWRRLKGDKNDTHNIAMQGMQCVIIDMFCNFLAGFFFILALLCFIEHSLNIREIEVRIPVTTVSSYWNKYLKLRCQTLGNKLEHINKRPVT